MRLAGACSTKQSRFVSRGKSGNFEANVGAQWLRRSAPNQPDVVHQLPEPCGVAEPSAPTNCVSQTSVAFADFTCRLRISCGVWGPTARALTMASASPKTCLRFGDGFILVEASMRLGICDQYLFRCPPVSCPLVSLSERLLGIDCAEDDFMTASQPHEDPCM